MLRYLPRRTNRTREKGPSAVVDVWVGFVAVIVGVAATIYGVWRVRARQSRERQRDALAQFDAQRPALEVEFLAAAAATGKPRGLRWVNCRLDGPATFAIDRTSAELYALVAATVSFAAIEGGGMEEVDAVSNLRAATTVFVRRDHRWTTDGRIVFNLGPAETLNHYRESLAAAPA